MLLESSTNTLSEPNVFPLWGARFSNNVTDLCKILMIYAHICTFCCTYV